METEVPAGRTTALFTLGSTSVASIVLALVHFLSSHSQGRISFVVDYIWETVILLSAFVGMVIIFLLRKNGNHMSVAVDPDTNTASWNKNKIVRFTTLTICGLASSLLPMIEAVRTISCLDHTRDGFLYAFKLTSFLVIAIFSFAQTTFLFVFRRFTCNSSTARILVSIVLSANIIVCINCFLDIIRASNTILYLGTSESRDNRLNHSNFFERTLVFSVCKNNSEQTDNMTLQLYKYTHPFSLEYALLSFSLLLPVWNVRIKTRQHGGINAVVDDNCDIHGSTNAAETAETTTDTGNISRRLNIFRISLKLVSKYSIYISLVFALSVFCTHVYVDVRMPLQDGNRTNSKSSTHTYTQVNYYLQTFYTYIICIVPFIGYMVSRKNNPSKWTFNIDNSLLFLSGIGMIALVVFETADGLSVLTHPNHSDLTEEALYFLKILFHYLGTYCQVMLILKAFGISTNTSIGQNQRLYIKGVIIFLGVCNAERWCVDTFLPPTPLRYASDISGDDTFGFTNWWLITELLYPIVVFYRLVSALLCFDIRNKLNQGV